VLEVRPQDLDAVITLFGRSELTGHSVPLWRLGTVTASDRLRVQSGPGTPLIDLPVSELRRAWKRENQAKHG
jgi:phosphoribosylformylglycinamidine (FGAM) synthase-like enzyme